MQTQTPFSAGTEPAKTPLPKGACDCHVHVYDANALAVAGAALHPPHASIDDYKQVQQRMGTCRTVVVTPSTYGTNNLPMLTGLAQLGEDGRGVAVLTGHEDLDELRVLHAQGVRGARINLSLGVQHTSSDIAKVAHCIAPMGWHLQLLMPLETLTPLASLLRSLPVDVVFDHFGRIPPSLSGRHPAHELLLALLHERRAWIKLSGGYLVSPTGSSEDPLLQPLARSFLEAASDRVIWGSDWPHATASAGRQPMPNDAAQVDALAQWAGDTHRLHQILVTNPEQLYGFKTVTSH
jgi:predicted TIM-barrel fold metal-dependent hydrolase